MSRRHGLVEGAGSNAAIATVDLTFAVKTPTIIYVEKLEQRPNSMHVSSHTESQHSIFKILAKFRYFIRGVTEKGGSVGNALTRIIQEGPSSNF
jgi:hypothetical protein